MVVSLWTCLGHVIFSFKTYLCGLGISFFSGFYITTSHYHYPLMSFISHHITHLTISTKLRESPFVSLHYIQLHKLIRCVICCFPLYFLPSIRKGQIFLTFFAYLCTTETSAVSLILCIIVTFVSSLGFQF